MAKPHIVIVDPAVKRAEIETFNRLVHHSALPLTYHLPALFGWDSLVTQEHAASIKGIMILGSGSSVWDKFDWQEALIHWLKPLMLRGVPTLGLCFGHQLIAHIFGGEIGPAFPDQHKAIGLRAVTLNTSRLWGTARQGSLVVSHREAIVRMPPSFRNVGSSPAVKAEAIEHDSLPIWGFQPHPEAGTTFLADQAISLTTQDLRFGHALVDDFLRIAAS